MMIIRKKTKDSIEYFLKKNLMDGLLTTIVFLGFAGLQYGEPNDYLGYCVYGIAIVVPLLIFIRRKWRRVKARQRLIE
jgi:hypothetical protein